MSTRETVTFQGVTYYRYPDSPRKSDRCYFRSGHSYLHRDIWEFHHGPIPKGYLIHHKDENTLNNDIDNLELLTKKDHQQLHAPTMREFRQQNVDRIRPLTIEWHRSEEGREWHRRNAKNAVKQRLQQEPVIKVCEQCGKPFKTVWLKATDRFCSNNCRSAYRRQSGVDNEQRLCVSCGKSFICNKYLPTKYCSSGCPRKKRN